MTATPLPVRCPYLAGQYAVPQRGVGERLLLDSLTGFENPGNRLAPSWSQVD